MVKSYMQTHSICHTLPPHQTQPIPHSPLQLCRIPLIRDDPNQKTVWLGYCCLDRADNVEGSPRITAPPLPAARKTHAMR